MVRTRLEQQMIHIFYTVYPYIGLYGGPSPKHKATITSVHQWYSLENSHVLQTSPFPSRAIAIAIPSTVHLSGQSCRPRQSWLGVLPDERIQAVPVIGVCEAATEDTSSVERFDEASSQDACIEDRIRYIQCNRGKCKCEKGRCFINHHPL